MTFGRLKRAAHGKRKLGMTLLRNPLPDALAASGGLARKQDYDFRMNTSPSTAPGNPAVETLRLYSDLLLAIRKSLTASGETTHETLAIMPDGVSTGPLPFPGNEGEALALWLDLRLHKLVIATSYGSRFELTLQGHSSHSFADAVLDATGDAGRGGGD